MTRTFATGCWLGAASPIPTIGVTDPAGHRLRERGVRSVRPGPPPPRMRNCAIEMDVRAEGLLGEAHVDEDGEACTAFRVTNLMRKERVSRRAEAVYEASKGGLI
jgi:hypothetical protein